MTPLHIFCVFAVLFLKLLNIHGQLCIPGQVRNLKVTSPMGLTWDPPLGNCPISSYLVTINRGGGNYPTLVFQVLTSELNVDDLDICERYEFNVLAISSDNVQGLGYGLSAKTPPHESLDLHVDVLNASQDDQGVLLTWGMKNGVEHCVDFFRIVVWNEDSIIPTDRYTDDTSIIIQNVVPCMNYEYQVRAIVVVEGEGDPIYVNHTATPQSPPPPTLLNIERGTTTVNLTWNLPSYSTNRCPITSIVVDASPNFRDIFPVLDSPARPPFIMELSSLQPNTIYLCRVYIVNSGGSSSVVAIAVQTLPPDGRNTSGTSIKQYQLQRHQLKLY